MKGSNKVHLKVTCNDCGEVVVNRGKTKREQSIDLKTKDAVEDELKKPKNPIEEFAEQVWAGTKEEQLMATCNVCHRGEAADDVRRRCPVMGCLVPWLCYRLGCNAQHRNDRHSENPPLYQSAEARRGVPADAAQAVRHLWPTAPPGDEVIQMDNGEELMVISARFASSCRICRQRIEPGDDVAKHRQYGWTHATCLIAQTATHTAARPAVC